MIRGRLLRIDAPEAGGPMACLTILTDYGDVERVPCTAGRTPPANVGDLVYWLGPVGQMLGWASANCPQARAIVAGGLVRSWALVEDHPLCGNCGSAAVGYDSLRPWCPTCRCWAD